MKHQRDSALWKMRRWRGHLNRLQGLAHPQQHPDPPLRIQEKLVRGRPPLLNICLKHRGLPPPQHTPECRNCHLDLLHNSTADTKGGDHQVQCLLSNSCLKFQQQKKSPLHSISQPLKRRWLITSSALSPG